MHQSILTSIKKLLGLEESYEYYDQDIIMHINSVLATLTQLGIGPADGFAITDKEAVWQDFIGNAKNLEAIRSYIYLKVRLLFDPPASSAVIESMNRQASEYEWRISVIAEHGPDAANGVR